MNNNTTVIKDLEKDEKKEFTFDYSFWSHDGFKVREDVNSILLGLLFKRI